MIFSIAMPKKESLAQLLRFGCVGIVNTVVDFGVLNACIFVFGVGDHGQNYVLFKTFSFLAAVTVSYVFNKYWVFAGNGRNSRIQEGLLFFMVSGIGFILNVSISTEMFLVASKFLPFRHYTTANIGALVGSLITLLWNFLGY